MSSPSAAGVTGTYTSRTDSGFLVFVLFFERKTSCFITLQSLHQVWQRQRVNFIFYRFTVLMRNDFSLVLSLETALILIPRVLGPGPRRRNLSF